MTGFLYSEIGKISKRRGACLFFKQIREIGNREVYFRSDICQTNGFAQIFLHEMNRYLHHILASATIAHGTAIPIFTNKLHGT